jgi:hypothetical protein
MNLFDDGQGDIQASIAYFRDHRDELGCIIAAEISAPGLSDHYPYCLELRDDRGNRLFLSGPSAGYPGDASRAAMAILVDAGFKAVDAQRVFRDRQVILRQPTWPPDPLPPPTLVGRVDAWSRGRAAAGNRQVAGGHRPTRQR